MTGEKLNLGRTLRDGSLIIKGRSEASIFPERHFHTSNRLITVDGPDGSGKGVVAQITAKLLRDKYGPDIVVLATPTRFDQSPEAEAIFNRLKAQAGLTPDSVRHNLHFMAALTVNYRKVIKAALEAGKIVVIDSSEIRSLAFMLDRGTEDTVVSTLRWIKSGRATGGLLAGNRIIVDSSPQDCLDNILTREKVDYGDPVDLDEAQRRSYAYKISMGIIHHLRNDQPPNWITFENPRLTGRNDIPAYLKEKIDREVIPALRL